MKERKKDKFNDKRRKEKVEFANDQETETGSAARAAKEELK